MLLLHLLLIGFKTGDLFFKVNNVFLCRLYDFGDLFKFTACLLFCAGELQILSWLAGVLVFLRILPCAIHFSRRGRGNVDGLGESVVAENRVSYLFDGMVADPDKHTACSKTSA